MKLALALALVVAACSSSPPPAPAPAPGPGPEPAAPASTPEPTPEPTPPPADAAVSAASCGSKPACLAPATCVSYFGIAGARGPQFHQCEIKCTPRGTACPDGKKCVTIADGPGSVCR